MRALSRRALLRGAGGAAIAIPFLPSLGRRAFAQERPAEPPTRFMVFGSRQGTLIDEWRPVGAEQDFELGPLLAPLQPHASELVVVSGLDNTSAREDWGDEHERALAHLLTATPMVQAQPGGPRWAGGISLDQRVAAELGGETRFRSLELGSRAENRDAAGFLSYAGPGQPIPAENRPRVAFERLFGEADAEAVARRRLDRRSVLDAVLGNLREVRCRVGAADRRRLDQHLQRVRELERRITEPPPANCAPPELHLESGAWARGAEFSWRRDAPEVTRAMVDLLAVALSCGLTRVASLHLSGDEHPWLRINPIDHWHDTLHSAEFDVMALPTVRRVMTWYTEQFAYLLQRLRETEEGEGSLLDHTLVLWANDFGDGRSHDYRDVPYVLAGRAGGALRTGRFLHYAGGAHNDLLLTCLHALGIEADCFGDPALCTGALPGLLG